MKAPVGLLSDRTVLRSKTEGPRPDKFTLTWLDFLYAGGHAFFQADVLLASAPIKIVLLVGLAAWGYLRKTKVA